MGPDKVTLGILAGGKSTRMGRDKALLLWNGRTLVEHVRNQFAACEKVLVSVADADRPTGISYPAVADERQGYGPLEGIYQLLAAAQTDWVFVAAADLPLVNEELLSCLLEALAAAQTDEKGILAVIPCAEGRVHPLCGLYHKRALAFLLTLFERGEHRVRALLDEMPVVYAAVEEHGIDPRMLSNVNTPEEFRQLEKEESGFPYVFAVCGVKNSGKTTYLEKLVAVLKKQGIRIGVIKHDGHDFKADVPGTDSSRMYRAGADATVVFSQEQVLFHERRKRTLDELLSLFAGYDLVLVEGAKASSLPKIELVRDGVSSAPASCGEGRIGIATDIRGYRAAGKNERLYPLDDVGPLAEELVRRLKLFHDSSFEKELPILKCYQGVFLHACDRI